MQRHKSESAEMNRNRSKVDTADTLPTAQYALLSTSQVSVEGLRSLGTEKLNDLMQWLRYDRAHSLSIHGDVDFDRKMPNNAKKEHRSPSPLQSKDLNSSDLDRSLPAHRLLHEWDKVAEQKINEAFESNEGASFDSRHPEMEAYFAKSLQWNYEQQALKTKARDDAFKRQQTVRDYAFTVREKNKTKVNNAKLKARSSPNSPSSSSTSHFHQKNTKVDDSQKDQIPRKPPVPRLSKLTFSGIPKMISTEVPEDFLNKSASKPKEIPRQNPTLVLKKKEEEARRSTEKRREEEAQQARKEAEREARRAEIQDFILRKDKDRILKEKLKLQQQRQRRQRRLEQLLQVEKEAAANAPKPVSGNSLSPNENHKTAIPRTSSPKKSSHIITPETIIDNWERADGTHSEDLYSKLQNDLLQLTKTSASIDSKIHRLTSQNSKQISFDFGEAIEMTHQHENTTTYQKTRRDGRTSAYSPPKYVNSTGEIDPNSAKFVSDQTATKGIAPSKSIEHPSVSNSDKKDIDDEDEVDSTLMEMFLEDEIDLLTSAKDAFVSSLKIPLLNLLSSNESNATPQYEKDSLKNKTRKSSFEKFENDANEAMGGNNLAVQMKPTVPPSNSSAVQPPPSRKWKVAHADTAIAPSKRHFGPSNVTGYLETVNRQIKLDNVTSNLPASRITMDDMLPSLCLPVPTEEEDAHSSMESSFSKVSSTNNLAVSSILQPRSEDVHDDDDYEDENIECLEEAVKEMISEPVDEESESDYLLEDNGILKNRLVEKVESDNSTSFHLKNKESTNVYLANFGTNVKIINDSAPQMYPIQQQTTQLSPTLKTFPLEKVLDETSIAAAVAEFQRFRDEATQQVAALKDIKDLEAARLLEEKRIIEEERRSALNDLKTRISSIIKGTPANEDDISDSASDLEEDILALPTSIMIADKKIDFPEAENPISKKFSSSLARDNEPVNSTSLPPKSKLIPMGSTDKQLTITSSHPSPFDLPAFQSATESEREDTEKDNEPEVMKQPHVTRREVVEPRAVEQSEKLPKFPKPIPTISQQSVSATGSDFFDHAGGTGTLDASIEPKQAHVDAVDEIENDIEADDSYLSEEGITVDITDSTDANAQQVENNLASTIATNFPPSLLEKHVLPSSDSTENHIYATLKLSQPTTNLQPVKPPNSQQLVEQEQPAPVLDEQRQRDITNALTMKIMKQLLSEAFPALNKQDTSSAQPSATLANDPTNFNTSSRTPPPTSSNTANLADVITSSPLQSLMDEFLNLSDEGLLNQSSLIIENPNLVLPPYEPSFTVSNDIERFASVFVPSLFRAYDDHVDEWTANLIREPSSNSHKKELPTNSIISTLLKDKAKVEEWFQFTISEQQKESPPPSPRQQDSSRIYNRLIFDLSIECLEDKNASSNVDDLNYIQELLHLRSDESAKVTKVARKRFMEELLANLQFGSNLEQSVGSLLPTAIDKGHNNIGKEDVVLAALLKTAPDERKRNEWTTLQEEQRSILQYLMCTQGKPINTNKPGRSSASPLSRLRPESPPQNRQFKFEEIDEPEEDIEIEEEIEESIADDF